MAISTDIRINDAHHEAGQASIRNTGALRPIAEDETSIQELLDKALEHLSPDDRHLLSILSDPTIIALESTPPDIIELVLYDFDTKKNLANPNYLSVEAIVDDALFTRKASNVDRFEPKIKNLLESIRLELPKADRIQELAELSLLDPRAISETASKYSLEAMIQEQREHATTDPFIPLVFHHIAPLRESYVSSLDNPATIEGEILPSFIRAIIVGRNDVAETISANLSSSANSEYSASGISIKDFNIIAREPVRQNIDTSGGAGEPKHIFPRSQSELSRNIILKRLIQAGANTDEAVEDATALIIQFRDKFSESVLTYERTKLDNETREKEISSFAVQFMEKMVDILRRQPENDNNSYTQQLKSDTGQDYLIKLASAYTSAVVESRDPTDRQKVSQEFRSKFGLAYTLPEYSQIVKIVIPRLIEYLPKAQVKLPGITLTQLLDLHIANFFTS